MTTPSPARTTPPRGLRAALIWLTLLMTVGATATLPSPAGAQTTAPLQVPPEFAACPEMTDSVFRLYSAYFLRLPDQGGYDFWIEAYAAGDFNLTTMSDFFAQSPEFQQRYGALDNEGFVELVYANVLRRTPDREGFFFWLDELDSGRVSRGGLMAFFSESPEFIELTGTLPPLAGHFSAYPVGTRWACGFGSADVPHATTGAFLDLYLLNIGRNTAAAEISIWTELRQLEAQGSWTIPSGQLVFAADHAVSPSVSTVSFQVDPEIVWIYVSQPTSIGSSRPGWGFRSAAMTAAQNDDCARTTDPEVMDLTQLTNVSC